MAGLGADTQNAALQAGGVEFVRIRTSAGRGCAGGTTQRDESAPRTFDGRCSFVESVAAIDVLQIELDLRTKLCSGGFETRTDSVAARCESLRIEAPQLAHGSEVLGHGVAHA